MILVKEELIFLVVITLISTVSYSQNFELTDAKKYRSLMGEIYFLTLFVETSDESWEDAEKDYYFQELIEGQNWIIEEGKKYDQQIWFNNEHFLFNQAEVFIDNIDELSPIELYEHVLDELQYKSFYHFQKMNNIVLHPNKLRILLFIKSQSRKHGFDYWEKRKSHIMKIYCSSTYGQLTDHYKISHEMLHHFGAWDLCYGESQNLSKAIKARQLYPHSIMARQIDWDQDVRIDQVTAWRIGWYYGNTDHFEGFEPDREATFDERQTSIKFKIRKENRNED